MKCELMYALNTLVVCLETQVVIEVTNRKLLTPIQWIRAIFTEDFLQHLLTPL
jgi:hypothetical protein